MNLAVIGNGNIVQSALSALKPLKGITVQAICVRPQSIAKGEEIQKEYDIPRLFTDYDTLLNDPDIDFVYIGIVNLLHYAYTKKALLAGKNVILEKPSCIHASEIKELAQIAVERHLYLFEAVTFLHNTFFETVRQALAKIGNVKIVQCNFSKYSSRYKQYLSGNVHPVFDPKFAGGTLLDLNIYNINFVVSLFGMPEKTVYFPVKGHNGIDTSGIAVLSYPTFVAECTGAKDSDSPGFMQIQGENGWIKIEGAPDNFKALHLCINNKLETTSLITERHRMADEFTDFLTIYEHDDFDRMRYYLGISINVCTTAEACLDYVKF